MTTEQGFALFIKALSGNNFSKETIRAYTADLNQFVEYLQSNRVDWNNPVRISRIDIVEFMNHLNTYSRSGTTRAKACQHSPLPRLSEREQRDSRQSCRDHQAGKEGRERTGCAL